MSVVELEHPSDYHNLPQPNEDSLGLSAETVYIASEPTSEGNTYTLVHSRPLASGPMATYLNNVGPLRFKGQKRYIRADYDHHLIRRDTTGDTRELMEEIVEMHSRLGRLGIGGAFMDFEAEVQDDWVDLLGDIKTDSVFETFNKMRAYEDFRATAAGHIGMWKEKSAYSPKHPHRGASDVVKRLEEFAPSDALSQITEENQRLRHKIWEAFRHQDGGKRYYVLADKRFSRKVAEHLDTFTVEEAEELIANCLSEYEFEGFGAYPLNGLVVDLAGQRNWFRQQDVHYMHYRNAEGHRQPLTYTFEPPVITYLGDKALKLSDARTGVALELGYGDGGDATRPLPWRITGWELPSDLLPSSRHAAIAWHTNRHGERSFLGHSETIDAVRRNNIPVPGVPDSYLGKLLVWHFRQEGEYEASKGRNKWLTEMGLPGSPSKRKITPRELPVWIQLPQHQGDLLNSDFIKATEALAA